MLHFPHPLTPPAPDRPLCREIREAAPVEGVAPGIVGRQEPPPQVSLRGSSFCLGGEQEMYP